LGCRALLVSWLLAVFWWLFLAAVALPDEPALTEIPASGTFTACGQGVENLALFCFHPQRRRSIISALPRRAPGGAPGGGAGPVFQRRATRLLIKGR